MTTKIEPVLSPERKITREMVELALGMAEYLESRSYARLDAIGIRTWNRQPATALRSMAAALESYLPQETNKMADNPAAPKMGDVARVTEPPPPDVTIAKVGPRRGTGPEWVVVDTDGGRWAVVPRTPGPDGVNWYAASRLPPE